MVCFSLFLIMTMFRHSMVYSTDNTNDKESVEYSTPDTSSLPVFGVNDFSLKSDGEIVANDKKTSNVTDQGVIDLAATLTSHEADVRVYNNGREYPITLSDKALSGKVILFNGNNYICIIIYKNGIRFSRSRVFLIRSTIPISPLRFELTWSGKGDLDLHVDDGKNKVHCYYSKARIHNKEGWNLELDVDNTQKKGPENIRIFGAPPRSKIRCYVNYYGGTITQYASVRLYRYGQLADVYRFTFSPKESKGRNEVDNKSWIVVEYIW